MPPALITYAGGLTIKSVPSGLGIKPCRNTDYIISLLTILQWLTTVHWTKSVFYLGL